LQNRCSGKEPGHLNAIRKVKVGSWPASKTIARKDKMAKKNKSQNMAQSIIDALKDGTAPWIKPWAPDSNAVPHNPVTGTRYKGINFLYLSMQDKPDSRWVTFKQAKEKNWKVKKGSKGTPIQFWQFEKDKKILNNEGQTVTERVKLERPLLRHYYVFNASDIEGMPEIAIDPKINNEWERHDRAENILKTSGATIEHVSGNKAAYSPSQDKIQMPQKGQFDAPDKYYATALHELGHWTGHESRLDRPLTGVFGSQDYAREELRAEIASYMVGMQLGIGHDPGQHLAYIDSWIKDLEDHPTEIFKASADAEKIQTYVMDFEVEKNRVNVELNKPKVFIAYGRGSIGSNPHKTLNVYVKDKNIPIDKDTFVIKLDNPLFKTHPTGTVSSGKITDLEAKELDNAIKDGHDGIVYKDLEYGLDQVLIRETYDGKRNKQIFKTIKEAIKDTKNDNRPSVNVTSTKDKWEVSTPGINHEWGNITTKDFSIADEHAAFISNELGLKIKYHDKKQEQKESPGQEVTKEDTMKQSEKPYYIITDDQYISLTTDHQLNGDTFSGEYAKFDDPSKALRIALELKETHTNQLEGSELYIYQVAPGNEVQKKPSLITGTPIQMKYMWEKNIGGEFPNKQLNDEIRSMPGMPESQENKLTSKRFISYYSGSEIDAAGNINLELQQALQRGTTVGVLRFENGLEMNLAKKDSINMQELKQAGIDGIILTKNGQLVEAVATDKSQLYKSMFQASKGLDKIYLTVPYADKDQAKQLGALWNKPAKSWYIPEGLDVKPFSKWKGGQSVTADNPHQQFADFIKEMGGDLKGQSPEMDGKIHRIPETEGKRGNKDVSYLGHLDGIPAGYVKNFRGGEKNWKMSGVVLTDKDRTRLRKESQEKKANREKERQELYKTKATESKKYTDMLKTATGQEEYFTNKGINIKNPNVKIDPKGSIVVSMQDIDGKQWSHQTLQRNGFKQIFKDSRLQGTFALIGANSIQDIKGDYNLTEGYSTGATVHEATGKPIIVCSTSNNLKHVALALHQKQPNRDIYIMADDDKYLADQGKVNTGIVKAKEAASAVGGHVIRPDFAKSRSDKNRTDFNDMARLRGKDTVRNHIKAKVDLARSGKKIKKEKVKIKEKTREKVSVER
jgi:antirestriction protein ArdC/phage/plasmid primase-like uncharacterized protein